VCVCLRVFVGVCVRVDTISVYGTCADRRQQVSCLLQAFPILWAQWLGFRFHFLPILSWIVLMMYLCSYLCFIGIDDEFRSPRTCNYTFCIRWKSSNIVDALLKLDQTIITYTYSLI